MKTQLHLTRLGAACALLLATGLAQAQVTIDQNKALAGNVTAGDGAGFPITLSQSGSYKLTSNLVVPVGAKGIVITAPNVTLDLNGFTLAGPSACTRDTKTKAVACTYLDGDTHGIDASATVGTAVRNGTVKGFAGYGILTGLTDRYEALRLTENWAGMGVFNLGVLISFSTFDTNSTRGLLLIRGLISNSRIIMNGGDGIVGSSSTLVSECTVASNREIGLDNLVARGTLTESNGTNRKNGFSMGGNFDNITPF